VGCFLLFFGLAYYRPEALSGVWGVVVVVLVFCFGIAWWMANGPHPALYGLGFAVGFAAALYLSILLGKSAFLAWFNGNAGALQAIAALVAIAVLALQSQLVSWQSDISSDLLKLEQWRDRPQLQIVEFEAAGGRSRTRVYRMTVVNRGGRGTAIEGLGSFSIVSALSPGDAPAGIAIRWKAPLLQLNPKYDYKQNDLQEEYEYIDMGERVIEPGAKVNLFVDVGELPGTRAEVNLTLKPVLGDVVPWKGEVSTWRQLDINEKAITDAIVAHAKDTAKGHRASSTEPEGTAAGRSN
jgi:hypothetical protein